MKSDTQILQKGLEILFASRLCERAEPFVGSVEERPPARAARNRRGLIDVLGKGEDGFSSLSVQKDHCFVGAGFTKI